MPYLNIPSGRIFYKEYFPSNKASPRATLLLHHGLGSTHAFYYAITPILTSPPYGYRLITYDSISSGLSDIASEPQSMQTLAKDAIDVLDALHVNQKVVFVGHSLGGVLAAEMAAEHGDRVVASVMLGPVLPSPTVKEAFEGRVKTVEKQGMEAMADTIPIGATGSKAMPLQHAMIRMLLLSQKVEGYCSMCKVVGGASVPDYEGVRMPTLLVAGEEDKSAPLEKCKEIFSRLRGEKWMEVVDGMGHWHCIERPEKMGEMIRGFVEQLRRNGHVL